MLILPDQLNSYELAILKAIWELSKGSLQRRENGVPIPDIRIKVADLLLADDGFFEEDRIGKGFLTLMEKEVIVIATASAMSIGKRPIEPAYTFCSPEEVQELMEKIGFAPPREWPISRAPRKRISPLAASSDDIDL